MAARPPRGSSVPIPEEVAAFVSFEHGPVTAVHVVGAEPGEPRLPVAMAVPADLSLVADGPDPQVGSACALDPATAVVAAVGEVVERTVAQAAPPSVRRRWLDAPDVSVDPERLRARGPGPADAIDRDLRRDDVLAWTEGTDLATGAPRWVPTQLVRLGSPPPDEPHGAVSTSSGLAAGRDLDRATTGAVWELVERDAVMCTWRTRTPPPRIPAHRWPEAAVHAASELALRSGAELVLLDLSAWTGLPVVMGAARSAEVGLVLGAAAAGDPARAATKAAIECVHTWRWAWRLRLAGVEVDPEEVQDFRDHVALHADPAHRHLGAWLFDGPDDGPPTAAVAPGWRALGAALAARDVEVVLADLTTPEVAGLGWRVVRAVAPDLAWLDVGAATYLHRPRLRALGAGPLSADPHPFP